MALASISHKRTSWPAYLGLVRFFLLSLMTVGQYVFKDEREKVNCGTLRDGPCTAGDVKISDIIVEDNTMSCFEGGIIAFDATLGVTSTADIKYDFGFWAFDGEIENGEPTCTVWSFPTGPKPYYNLNNNDCGDGKQKEEVTITVSLEVPCQPDKKNNLEVELCATWSQSANTNPTCTLASDTLPGTGSKCRCEEKSVDIRVLPPTASPTSHPTEAPTSEPTLTPSSSPSSTPTSAPTPAPTPTPTSTPSSSPSSSPTSAPTPTPTSTPSSSPSSSPTSAPTPTPTSTPSSSPSSKPSVGIICVDVSIDCVPDAPPANQACGSSGIKPTRLEFNYTGSSCDASQNEQGSKFKCSDEGGFSGSEKVVIAFTDKDGKLLNGVEGQEALIGDKIAIESSNFGSEIRVSVKDVSDAQKIQMLKIHTSCSKPLNKGDIFGSLTLESATYGDSPPTTCENIPMGEKTCDSSIKPFKEMSILFDPSGCENFEPDKGSCTDFISDPRMVTQGVTIKATDRNGQSVGVSSEVVSAGDTFRLVFSQDPGNEVTLVSKDTNGENIQEVTMHISCSSAIFVQIASYRPKSITGTDGSTQGTSVDLIFTYTVRNDNDQSVEYSLERILEQVCAGIVESDSVAQDMSIGGNSVDTITETLSIDTSVKGPVVVTVTADVNKLGECDFDIFDAVVVDSSLGGSDCGESKENKPRIITFKLLEGGGCGDSSNNQPSDKAVCTGDPIDGSPATVSATGGKDKVLVVSPSTVSVGDEFSVGEGGETLGSEIVVTVIDSNGHEQINKLHTSCSQPLSIGDRYGALEIVRWVAESGNTIPSGPPGQCT